MFDVSHFEAVQFQKLKMATSVVFLPRSERKMGLNDFYVSLLYRLFSKAARAFFLFFSARLQAPFLKINLFN